MPVKKTTTKKATTAKKPAVKKFTTKKPVAKKAAIKKPTVIVETKKTEKNTNCTTKNCKGFISILFVVLLLLNLLFGVLNFMKQDSALELEKMKVGGSENFEKVMELYESDFYKQQQSAAIQQFMAQ